MMDIEKLIDRLSTESLYVDKASLEIMELCMDAATVLSTLQAENEELRGELESVRAERNAAVECIETVYAKILIKCKTDAVRAIEKWKNKERSDNEV